MGEEYLTGSLAQTFSDGVCTPEVHAYPKIYAGDPQYAAAYFSRCLCGKKRKVTTITEVDVDPKPTPITKEESKNAQTPQLGPNMLCNCLKERWD